MRTTKIKIKNLFGISEQELDERSIEITGKNGVGKSSIIDAIRYGLTNKSNRDFIIKKGENEGEILIETDSSLMINRKAREGQTDYKNIRLNNKPIASPEAFLDEIFTPLQLDPVAFTKMTRQEQNRAILNLIEFNWDRDYIIEKFGEIPAGLNLDQHILKVLDDIQSEGGVYFKTRTDINRDVRNKEAEKSKLVQEIPSNYDYKKWKSYNLNEKYMELTQKKDTNSKIERAKAYSQSYQSKINSLELQRKSDIDFEKSMIETEKTSLNNRIEKLKMEIKSCEEKLSTIDDSLKDKIEIHEKEFEANKAKLDKDNAVACEWSNKEEFKIDDLEEEVNLATQMIQFIQPYQKMTQYDEEINALKSKADNLTEKIELARELPSEILKTAKIPVKNLTVENGIPMIDRGNGALPIANLSEGEQLDLCIDVTINRPNSLKIILIDGIEKMSSENRERIYQKCRDAKLQFIATRTTDSPELEVHYLEEK